MDPRKAFAAFGLSVLACLLYKRWKQQRKSTLGGAEQGKDIFARASKQVLPHFQTTVRSLLKSDSSSAEAFNEPVLELLRRPGKRVRPVLGSLIARCFGWPNEHHQATLYLVITIELLHNCSLVVDDIQDGSQQRRQMPCIHKMFGVNKALKSSNYIYFKVMSELLLHIPKQFCASFMEIYFEQMTLSHLGQAQDLSGHHLPFHDEIAFLNQLPNEEQYIRMVVSKTGGLLRMLTRWICVLYRVDKDVESSLLNMVESFSICFQIRDDIINLKQQMGKGMTGEDLLERKVTLMVIHSIGQLRDPKFLRMFLKNQKQATDIPRMIELIKSNGSLTYAQNVFQRYAQTTMEAFNGLPDTDIVKDLKLVVRMIVYRTS